MPSPGAPRGRYFHGGNPGLDRPQTLVEIASVKSPPPLRPAPTQT
ncbi:hypothetical protein CPAR01_10105 [Colletotrichum paranaense]|uniref:Uncharacterized protein n=4 Tax=Colletotrichum acutatum species complex TaxID=2707335 RepID=A0AAI9YJR7_9PEZI|nr:uncharacterized protein CCOS01_14443 [Colletotrichum costaricense]XP_060346550.1 uncharacterized protein CPAR01_10105 [Colletotrichum paranaense]XP_060379671.1 uncharacterized protein CTAM01_09583 [Colletotrichum tamarilloi]KAK1458038.1 hypothetical protein CMEL01_15385 [Colletotrichum melonis]KAK1492956.1 hypothetical protein CTAM01_09583 [Colletotrichum tamarilloi]KAK1513501.1 hypothetical protein CCOS01_14443 [Colletotrichum costaricense]KAK1533397.1 hypothetical protein CPAR01_10105 [C